MDKRAALSPDDTYTSNYKCGEASPDDTYTSNCKRGETVNLTTRTRATTSVGKPARMVPTPATTKKEDRFD